MILFSFFFINNGAETQKRIKTKLYIQGLHVPELSTKNSKEIKGGNLSKPIVPNWMECPNLASLSAQALASWDA